MAGLNRSNWSVEIFLCEMFFQCCYLYWDMRQISCVWFSITHTGSTDFLGSTVLVDQKIWSNCLQVFCKETILETFVKFSIKLLFMTIHIVCLQNFLETNIAYLLICTRTCGYQGDKNVSLSESFAYVPNEWSLTELLK